MAVVIFRDTMQRTVFTKTTKVLCLVSSVLYYDTQSSWTFRRNDLFKKEKLYLTGMVLTLNSHYYMQSSQPKRTQVISIASF